ncbi:MAG: hypothetical protein MUE40_15495 [Anaerolineae bacterium]|jgi:putative flippase GtrA|nr:hypothetical protein [Anaerolineae bacterium]
MTRKKSARRPSPDNLLFVLVYFILMIVVGGGGALVLLATALPMALQMGVPGGAATIGLTIAFSGVLAGGAAYCARGLWQRREAGRAAAVIYAALLLVLAVVSLPVLALSLDVNSADFLLPALAAVLIGLASGVVLRYLIQPDVKDLFT